MFGNSNDNSMSQSEVNGLNGDESLNETQSLTIEVIELITTLFKKCGAVAVATKSSALYQILYDFTRF